MPKRKHIVGLVVLLAIAIGLAVAHQRGHFWKKTIKVPYPKDQFGVCELHGTALEIETVEVRPERITVSPMNGYEEAERTLFPRANNWNLGGYPRNAGWIERLYCPECRKAADEWAAKKIADGSA